MGTKTRKSSKRDARDVTVLLSLPPDAPITLSEVAIIAATSKRFVMGERAIGRGPRCYALGGKAIRSTVGDALAWVKSRAEGAA